MSVSWDGKAFTVTHDGETYSCHIIGITEEESGSWDEFIEGKHSLCFDNDDGGYTYIECVDNKIWFSMEDDEVGIASTPEFIKVIQTMYDQLA